MNEIIKNIFDHIKDLPVWLSVSALSILGGFYFRYHLSINRNLYDKTKLQIDRIGDYLSKNLGSSSELKQILVAELDDQIFRHIFGYRLPRQKRELLLPIVNAPDSPASWETIKSARGFLRIEGSILVVNKTRFDRFDYFLKHVLSFLCLGLVALICLAVSQSSRTKALTPSEGIVVASFVIFLSLASVSMLLSTMGYATATRIERWLTVNRNPEGRQ